MKLGKKPPALSKGKPAKDPPKSSRKSSKKKQPLVEQHEAYLNQNIVINTRDPLRVPIVQRRIASAMNVRTGSVLTKHSKRAESVIGMIKQSLHDRKLDTVDPDKLVTEEDYDLMEDEYSGYLEEKESQCTGITTMRHLPGRLSEEQAALLIQKMWRGYQTRRLVNRYILLLNQRKLAPQSRQPRSSFNETKKYKKKGKKLTELVDLEKTQKIPSWRLKAEIEENNTFKSEESPNQKRSSPEKVDWSSRLERLRSQREPNWSQMVGIISEVPSLDANSKGKLIELIQKIRDGANGTAPIFISDDQNNSIDVEKPQEIQVIINNKPLPPHQESVAVESESHVFDEPIDILKVGDQEHPWLKVLDMRMKMIKSREKAELKILDGKLQKGELDQEAYELKKERIVGRYLRQRKEVLDHMEQINVGVERLNDNLLRTKIDACYLYQVCGKDYSIRHSLSSESLIQQFIKCRDMFQLQDESFEMIHTQSSIQEFEIIPPRYDSRTHTELQSPKKSENIADRLVEDAQLKAFKSSTEKIQQLIQEMLIEDMCRQIYLNDGFYKAYTPLIDIHHSYSFSKVTDKDIGSFLNIIELKFMPNPDVLLSRLNQKINPTPYELLRILRNEEIMGSENEFYELVIPQNSFKLFREWKELQPPDHPSKLIVSAATEWPFQIVLSQPERRKWNQRASSLQEKKRKLVKFEKDLQAMYFKSAFNCFNECIIDVKSSFSPLNGRSTIGPGQLHVSMQDSNIKVSLQQVPSIVSRAKQRVLDNLLYKCPVLDQSNYLSLYRFQDQLNKQLHHDFSLSEYKWVSFFDEFLELAMEISKVIEDIVFEQLVKELPQRKRS